MILALLLVSNFVLSIKTWKVKKKIKKNHKDDLGKKPKSIEERKLYLHMKKLTRILKGLGEKADYKEYLACHIISVSGIEKYYSCRETLSNKNVQVKAITVKIESLITGSAFFSYTQIKYAVSLSNLLVDIKRRLGRLKSKNHYAFPNFFINDFPDNLSFGIVFEMYPDNLKHLLITNKNIEYTERMSFIHQLLFILDDLHTNGIALNK
jgi:hypothetical protein